MEKWLSVSELGEQRNLVDAHIGYIFSENGLYMAIMKNYEMQNLDYTHLIVLSVKNKRAFRPDRANEK